MVFIITIGFDNEFITLLGGIDYILINLSSTLSVTSEFTSK